MKLVQFKTVLKCILEKKNPPFLLLFSSILFISASIQLSNPPYLSLSIYLFINWLCFWSMRLRLPSMTAKRLFFSAGALFGCLGGITGLLLLVLCSSSSSISYEIFSFCIPSSFSSAMSSSRRNTPFQLLLLLLQLVLALLLSAIVHEVNNTNTTLSLNYFYF